MDVSDIFYFFCSGRRKGESEAPVGWGVGFFIEKSPRGGGKAGRGRAARRVSVANWRIFGGAKFFFSGAERSTKEMLSQYPQSVFQGFWGVAGGGGSAANKI